MQTVSKAQKHEIPSAGTLKGHNPGALKTQSQTQAGLPLVNIDPMAERPLSEVDQTANRTPTETNRTLNRTLDQTVTEVNRTPDRSLTEVNRKPDSRVTEANQTIDRPLTEQQPNLTEDLTEFGTPECERWRNGIFDRHPLLRSHLKRYYKYKAKQHGYVCANQWLGELTERLKLAQTGLRIDADPEQIEQYAKLKAAGVHRDERLAYVHTIDIAGKEVAESELKRISVKLVEDAGLTFPFQSKRREAMDWVNAIARACDPGWWKRQLLTLQRRQLEGLLRELNAVCKSRAIYVSDITLARRQIQKRKNRQMLSNMEAINEEAEVVNLQDAADSTISNPAIRRAELMVRMRGFENFANNSDQAFTGVFLTITCPSKYHATHEHGQPNAKFEGYSPQDAQNYLNGCWIKVRAAWNRRGFMPFGFRVVEPHHDGTPHWHMMLFFQADQAKEAVNLYRKYALAEDGDERGASQHRFASKIIDPNIGSATGYIAKYIAKNIDGFGLDSDLYGKDAKLGAARIEAWASTWGIRQFQQIGGASVTIYRELRRLEASGSNGTLIQNLIAAADQGDWEAYTELMGGAICKRADRPLRPLMIEKEEMNRYGEYVKELKGLLYREHAIITRLHTWTVRLAQSTCAPDQEESEANARQNDLDANLASKFHAPPGARSSLEFCQ